MGTLASRYARWLHRRLQRTGHLFEARYRAIVVDNDRYALELLRYIHRNPLRSGLAENLRDYPWSSHAAYLGGPAPPWLTTHWMLRLFAATERTARRRYAGFMDIETDETTLRWLRHAHDQDRRLLGDDDFVARVTRGNSPERPPGLTCDAVIAAFCGSTGLTEAALRRASRREEAAAVRAMVAVGCRELRVATSAEIARRFGRSDSALSRRAARLTEAERRKVTEICQMLRSQHWHRSEGDAEGAAQGETEDERRAEQEP